MRRFRFANIPSLQCFCLGAMATLALAPLNFWPAMIALVPPLVMMASAPDAKMAARLAFMTSWGWLFASLYWIGQSLLVEGGAVLLLLPFVMLGLPAGLALFWALSVCLAYRLSPYPEMRLVWIALGIGCADILRSVIFTGFPWNVMAHLFLVSDISSQSIYFTGQHALNLVAICGIAGLAFIWQRRFVWAIWLLLPALFLMVIGANRLVSREQAIVAVNAASHLPDIRIIQPNISQKEKWQRGKQDQHLAEMIKLANQQNPVPPLLILPETAIAALWPKDQEKAVNFVQKIAPFDGYVLAGMLRLEQRSMLHNTAFLFSQSGQPVARYDKIHLVPFGEYAPFRFIPFVDVIAGPIDFSSGMSAQPYLQLPQDSPLAGLKIALLICYEVIFSGFLDRVKSADDSAADIIVNLTNDGWFGHTTGPYQHLAQARFRAIEEAKPLVRVANTGISAVFDRYGAELGSIGLARAGFLDIQLDRTAKKLPQTPLWKDIARPLFGMIMLLLVMAFYLIPLFCLEIFRQTQDKSNME